jgi:acetylornithine/N-succinyldiaminopimelate aminotransferase
MKDSHAKDERRCRKETKQPETMESAPGTFATEDALFPPFFQKTGISIARGKGVFVWDEAGRKYLDFTAGWGVTSIGHASHVITKALAAQSRRIIQNPNSGATYSPRRAELLRLMQEILPCNLRRVFFANSGAEANDAAMKLARKITGRRTVISALGSFHGRTISAASATGQAKHRDRFSPLMPHHEFVPYNDVAALAKALHQDVAAVILEPIQGEGGVIVPSDDYLESVSELCEEHGALLIVDEVQTSFFRTGPAFAISGRDIKAHFLTMAKGMGGGFPIGAFAVPEEIALRFEKGDHGGTYCGNPLGCAVASAVIGHLLASNVGENVERVGNLALKELDKWKADLPGVIRDVRGKGLLLAIEFAKEEVAGAVFARAFEQGVILNLTQGRVIRLFPALTITEREMKKGLGVLRWLIGEISAAC